MKILVISHEYPPIGGGGANACRALASEFAMAGHTVHILTAGYDNTPFWESSCDGRLVITRVRSKRNSRDHCSAAEMLDYILKASREAKRILSHETFDICLCFFGIPGGILASSLKHKYDLGYIVRMGGGDIPGFQDRFQILYRIVGPGLRMIWREADALVANSEGLRQMAREFCDRYPIQVIPNGVDTDTFIPTEVGAKETGLEKADPVRLLTVCRLIKRKGLQDIIPAIRTIEKQAGVKVRWTIAGDGPYLEELKRLSREDGINRCIDFVGHVERAKLPNLYREADIFVFPSHREGMPNAVLEAMASGLPIIMRKDCQSADELVLGNGMRASGDFADSITDLIRQGKERWREMGRESRALILSGYTWEQISKRYMELFEMLTSDRS